jgi:hypothetical protein
MNANIYSICINLNVYEHSCDRNIAYDCANFNNKNIYCLCSIFVSITVVGCRCPES